MRTPQAQPAFGFVRSPELAFLCLKNFLNIIAEERILSSGNYVVHAIHHFVL